MSSRTKNDLEHWLDPLSPGLASRLETLILELHRHSSLQKNVKKELDIAQREAENELGIDHLVNDRLALKITFELKNYDSFENAHLFLQERRKRVGQDHFGTLVNLALLQELEGSLSTTFEFEKALLDSANKEYVFDKQHIQTDPVKQLLALVLIGKNKKQRQMLKESKTIYDNISYLVQRVEKTGIMNEENRYYYVLACQELAFFHRFQKDKISSVLYFKKSLDLVSTDLKDLDLAMEIHIFIIRALKLANQSGSIIKSACLDLISKMNRVLEHRSTIGEYEFKYGKILLCGYLALSFGQNMDESFVNLGKQLFRIHQLVLGTDHHEVMLLAAQVANNCFRLRMLNEAQEFINFAKSCLARHSVVNLKPVLVSKIKTTHNLSIVYRSCSRYIEAIYWGKEELRMIVELYGPKSQFVSKSLDSLSSLFNQHGMHEEATKYLQKSLEIIVQCYPNLTERQRYLETKLLEAQATLLNKNQNYRYYK